MKQSPSSSQKRSDRQKELLAKLQGRLFRASELEEKAEVPERNASASAMIQGLERIETERGTFSKATVRVSLDGSTSPQGICFPHGAEASNLRPELVSVLACDEEFADIPLDAIAFIDAETTGLSGGTGTYVFLVGIGFFDGDEFVVEQYFMEDYDEEAPMIEALRQRMADFEGIVSYNGKSFDIPLLRTRFIFNRTPSVWEKPHLDLLHLSRRFWKARLTSCGLGSIERHILGVHRESDVDGSLIPGIYFDFVNGVRRGRMVPVFDHHAQDIVSLGSLMGRMGRMVDEPDHERFRHPSDQVGLANLFEMWGNTDASTERLESALRELREPVEILNISMRIAYTYKRSGRWSEACEIWEAQIESGPKGHIAPHVELAKYCEHRERDYRRAIEIVEHAIRQLDFRKDVMIHISDSFSAENDSELNSLEHRLNRLKKRQSAKESREEKPDQ